MKKQQNQIKKVGERYFTDTLNN